MIFLGCLFDRQEEKVYLNKSKCGLSNAVNTLQWNLIEGLNANLEEKVEIISVLPVGIYPIQYKDLVLHTRKKHIDGSVFTELGSINLPFIKQYQRYRKCLKMLRKSTDKQIIIYSAYYPYLKAISKLDSTYTITLIVPDLPEYYDYGKTSKIKAFFRKRNNLKIRRCMRRVDKFVLLTEHMKEPLEVGNRPYTVVEGICDSEVALPTAAEASDKKIILYTGTLHEKFGIGELLEAFGGIASDAYRLWICGWGDMHRQVQAAAEKDLRISFFGYVSKEKAMELQRQATVLVNPRRNNECYTKYSFPSKTIEYMLSGKPVIMYKLDGIPDEYDPHLFYVTDDTVEALRDQIVDVCERSREERETFGKAAFAFVKTEKNSKVQTKKILIQLRCNE